MQKMPDIGELIQEVERGRELSRRLRNTYYEDSCMHTVFLFAEDDEMNYYTVYYLPVYARSNRVSSFLIVSCIDGAGDMVERTARVPYKFVSCTKEDAHAIGRYCTELDAWRRKKENIIISGTDDPEDYRYRAIIGIKGIDKADIVSMSVFEFDKTPDEEEAVLPYERWKVKGIDWEAHASDVPEYNGEALAFPKAVEEEMDRLINIGRIRRNDSIVVFSYTRTTRHIVEYLSGYNIAAVLDNDIEKDGMEINGVPVYYPDRFFQRDSGRKYKIIVPTRSYVPICEQLHYYGYELGKNMYITYRGISVADAGINSWSEAMPKGGEMYSAIRRDHPDERIYMCTYKGTGDAFLIGMYLRDRMMHDNASGCVLVVASKACKKLLETFGLNDIVKEIYALDGREECDKLLYYVRAIGYDKANAAVLNNDYGALTLMRISGVKGVDFNTVFQKMIFFSETRRLGADIKKESADRIFEDEGVREGETIMLSPYAHTTSGVSDGAWEELAVRLMDAGYDVCTNVSGDDEKPVKGTRGIFVPYPMLIDFLDRAGGFVGLRSGLCDIISGSKAMKVVLYPERAMFHCSTYYNYFSLEKMFNIEDGLKEIIVGEDEEEMVNEAVAAFTGEDKA